MIRSITELKKTMKNIDKEELFLKLKKQVESGEFDTLLAALNEFCEDNDIEPEKINKYLHPSLKSLLYKEAIKLGMMSQKTMKESKLDGVFED